MLVRSEELGEIVYKAWIEHTGSYSTIKYSELLPKEQSLYIAIGQAVAVKLLNNNSDNSDNSTSNNNEVLVASPRSVDIESLDSLIENLNYCDTAIQELIGARELLFEHYKRKMQMLPINEEALYNLLKQKFKNWDDDFLKQAASVYINMPLNCLNDCLTVVEDELVIDKDNSSNQAIAIVVKFIRDLLLTFIS